MRGVWWRGPAILLGALCFALPAYAGDNASDVDKARSLGRTAADLIDQKRFADALDHATRAEALYHAPTHLLLMAESQEGLEKLAAAAEIYERLVAEPLPSGSPAAFRSAQEHGKTRLRALLARLPSLLVNVTGPPLEEVTATIDGKPLALRSGVAVRLDPGGHSVKVTASGYEPAEKAITLPPRGGVVVIEISLMHPRDAAAPVASAPSASSASPRSASPQGPGKVNRTPEWISFGLGGAGLVVGAVTGALSLGKVGGLKDRCPDGHCAESDRSDADSARMLGNVSTAGFVVGAIGLTAGVVFLLVHSKPGKEQPPVAAAVHAPITFGFGPGGWGARF
jgi:hypothetical protein